MVLYASMEGQVVGIQFYIVSRKLSNLCGRQGNHMRQWKDKECIVYLDGTDGNNRIYAAAMVLTKC